MTTTTETPEIIAAIEIASPAYGEDPGEGWWHTGQRVADPRSPEGRRIAKAAGWDAIPSA